MRKSLETLKYAEENKHNIELIDSILEKARPQKTATGVHCAGLTHREASPCCWPAIFPKRSRRCISWPRRSSWRLYGKPYCYVLRRCICRITA